MSDLGRCSDLTNWLAKGGMAPVEQPFAPKQNQSSALIPFDEGTAREVGEHIGRFLATLHSPETYELILAKQLARFHRTDSDEENLIRDITVIPIQGHLDRYGIEHASELSRRVRADFERVNQDWERSFIIGDTWPGTFLIGRSPDGQLFVGAVDWEFARIGRGVTGDVAQLLAHLHLHLLAAREGSTHRAAVICLIMAMTSSYRRVSKVKGSKWTEVISAEMGPTPAIKALRSVYLLHGREMINCAIENAWSCQCCGSKIREGCSLRKTMVEAGAWYLQMAEENDERFAKKLATLTEETVVAGLFHD